MASINHMRSRWLSNPAALAIGLLASVCAIGLVWLYWPTIRTAVPIGKSGVYGKVILQEGDCMPSIGGDGGKCRMSGVSRAIYFYKPALPFEALSGTHYTGTARPIATAKSDRAGAYQADLPPGEYSVLAEDEGGPFCNTSTDTAACGITVTGAAQQHDITIDHAVH